MNLIVNSRSGLFSKLMIFFFFTFLCRVEAKEAQVKIFYLGHSAFAMQFGDDITVVMDYGHPNAWVQWGWDSPIHDIGDLIPDILTYSHKHDDHYDASRIPAGVSYILTDKDSLDYKGLTIRPIRTCEENINVESNTSFLFSYQGLNILHLGDAQAQIMNIENPIVRDFILDIIPDSLDLLFMTIEGQNKFIPQAVAFVDLIQPKRIIPMHHWSEAYLREFLTKLKENDEQNYQIVDKDTSYYELNAIEKVEPIVVFPLKRSPFTQFPASYETIIDYDGNVYHVLEINNQFWLQENLRTRHYSDGTEIPDVVAYNESDSLEYIYGLLYTWDAAMNNSPDEGAQGACPCGWHVPSDEEWKELEESLGGADIAGGKMKVSGTKYWTKPNMGAENAVDFSLLPGGEFDAFDQPFQFRLLGDYAVLWTSTQLDKDKARERYVAFNKNKCESLDWYKVLKYSVRCIKDNKVI